MAESYWRERAGNKQNGAVSVNTNLSRSTFTQEYTLVAGNFGPTIILTPSAGKRLTMYDVEVNSEGTTGDIRAVFATSSIIVEVAYLAKSVQQNRNDLNVKGDVDEGITLTATSIGNNKRMFITINYEETD